MMRWVSTLGWVFVGGAFAYYLASTLLLLIPLFIIVCGLFNKMAWLYTVLRVVPPPVLAGVAVGLLGVFLETQMVLPNLGDQLSRM